MTKKQLERQLNLLNSHLQFMQVTNTSTKDEIKDLKLILTTLLEHLKLELAKEDYIAETKVPFGTLKVIKQKYKIIKK